MNNLERFKKALNWEPIDRLMTYDYLDNREILVQHGGFDSEFRGRIGHALVGGLIEALVVNATHVSDLACLKWVRLSAG